MLATKQLATEHGITEHRITEHGITEHGITEHGMTEHIVTINEQGELQFVYSDDLAGLGTLGTASISRASHVEPNANGLWEADLAPVAGPVLGPFALRKYALDAEVAWLKNNL